MPDTNLQITPLEIPDIKLLRPPVFGDDRGSFFESFRSSWLPDVDFVQDNHSRSDRGTLRGLHYQLAHPQGKLVRVVSGSVYDVAVDIRRASPTFGHWVAHVLSDDKPEILWIPEGFAHGFLVLSRRVDFVYKCTRYHAPGDEYAVRWDDPALAIDWPREALPPIMSGKDKAAPLLRDAKVFDSV